MRFDPEEITLLPGEEADGHLNRGSLLAERRVKVRPDMR
jgi:hypothetical protein